MNQRETETSEQVLKFAPKEKAPNRVAQLDDAGQAIVAHRGEWVQYSSPGPEGAEYIAACLPAFSPQTVHRDSP